MGADTVYIDGSDIERGIFNGFASIDFTPFHRACWVFELQEVEKRLEALGHRRGNLHFDGDDEAQRIDEAIDGLWRRRGELLSVLWGTPTEDSKPAVDDLAGGSRGRP